MTLFFIMQERRRFLHGEKPQCQQLEAKPPKTMSTTVSWSLRRHQTPSLPDWNNSQATQPKLLLEIVKRFRCQLKCGLLSTNETP